jgi:hypothetical protein
MATREPDLAIRIRRAARSGIIAIERSARAACHAAVACGVAAGLFTSPPLARAGWVIDQVVREGNATSRQQLLFESDRMKTVVLDAGGQPLAAVIVDLGAQTITQVDYLGRHYVTATIDEHVRAAHQARQQALTELTEVTRQVERDTQDLPPSERAEIEGAMREQMKQAASSSLPCRSPRVELRKTGRREVIAGYEAVSHEVLVDGKRDSEVWIARDIGAWRELDARKVERFSMEIARLSACSEAGEVRRFRDGAALKLAREGFAMRTVVANGGATQQVVKADQRPVPAEEFEPPNGFARSALSLPR